MAFLELGFIFKLLLKLTGITDLAFKIFGMIGIFFYNKLAGWLFRKMRPILFNWAVSTSKYWMKCKWNAFVSLFKSDVKVPIKLVLGNVIRLKDQKFPIENGNTMSKLFDTALNNAKGGLYKEIPFDVDVIGDVQLCARPIGSGKNIPYMECTNAGASIDPKCEYILLIELFDNLKEDEEDHEIRPIVLFKEKLFVGKSNNAIWKIFKKNGWYIKRMERGYGHIWTEIQEKEHCGKVKNDFLAHLTKKQQERLAEFIKLQKKIDEDLEMQRLRRSGISSRTLPLGLDGHQCCLLEIVHPNGHSSMHSLVFLTEFQERQTLEQLILSYGDGALSREFFDVLELMDSPNACFHELIYATGEFVEIRKDRLIRAKHCYKLDLSNAAANVTENSNVNSAATNEENANERRNQASNINLVILMPAMIITILLLASVFIDGPIWIVTKILQMIYYSFNCNLPFLLSFASIFILLCISRHFSKSESISNGNEESTSINAEQTMEVDVPTVLGIGINSVNSLLINTEDTNENEHMQMKEIDDNSSTSSAETDEISKRDMMELEEVHVQGNILESKEINDSPNIEHSSKMEMPPTQQQFQPISNPNEGCNMKQENQGNNIVIGGAVPSEWTDEWFHKYYGIHFGIICDGCQEKDFQGIRLKCAECPDFDLCLKCHIAGQHSKHRQHFLVIEPTIEKEMHDLLHCTCLKKSNIYRMN